MTLATILSELCLMLVCVAASGLTLLHLIRFRYQDRADLVLATVAAGLASAAFSVCALLALNLYVPATAWAILLGPAAWLAYRWTRTRRLLPERTPPKAPATQLTRLDTVAIFAAVLLLLALLLDSATSPLREWDAVVSWDKWAIDYARRTNLYGYSHGAYPQLLPMFSSLLYKATGHWGLGIPTEQYTLHTLHGLLGFLLLLAMVRAAQLLEVAVWLPLLMLFGMITARAALTAGSADILITTYVTMTATLCLGWKKRQWEASHDGAGLFIASLFGAIFSKGVGWLLLAFFAAAQAVTPRMRKGTLAACLIAPVLLALPYYAADRAANKMAVEQYTVGEENMHLFPLGTLAKISDASYGGKQGWDRLPEAWKRWMESYGLPDAFIPTLGAAAQAVLIAFAIAGLTRPLVRPVAVLTLAISVAWFHYSSYDFRNLIPAIPLLGLWVSSGGVLLAGWAARWRWARFVFIGAAGWLGLAFARHTTWEPAQSLQEMSARDGGFAARLQAAGADTAERAKRFFPLDFEMWSWLSRTHFLEHSHHVAADSVMYRWIPHSVMAASDWDRRIMGRGDLYILQRPLVPVGDYQDWTLIRANSFLQTWLWEPEPVTVQLADLVRTDSFLGMNLTDRSRSTNETIVWRVQVDGDQPVPDVRACVDFYNPSFIDQELTNYNIDVMKLADHVVSYSGTLVLRPGERSQKLADRMWFGLCKGAVTPVVKNFRYSTYRW